MSTSTRSSQQSKSTSLSTLRRQSATPTTSLEEATESTSLQQQFSLIQFDFATPTLSAAGPSDDVPTSVRQFLTPSATCSLDSNCTSDRACLKGTCASLVEAAPFGPAGGPTTESTTKISTASAIGVSAGVIGLVLLLIGLGIWFWKRRGRRLHHESIEAAPATRNRSASSATDQKTLVASVPNSPHNAHFHVQHDEMGPAFFAKLAQANNPLRQHQPGTEKFAHERRESIQELGHQKSLSTKKALPLPPNNMPLPLPPTEEKRYAINVNINKSMIFEDLNFNITNTPRDSEISRDRMPRYRFEEYLPPVTRTPRLSITKAKPKQLTSDYEMASYPRKNRASEAHSSTADEEENETQLRRIKTLKKLESKPPQLPLPEIPPPSPSFSFNSYDWYQDIIGNEGNLDDPISRAPTPSIPERNPARTPTQATFGAVLLSNPLDSEPFSLPRPLSLMSLPSPRSSSLLHPSTAALPSPATLLSPTSPNFRLSPTVYTMPSRPPKVQPARISLQSTARQSTITQKTHVSRSWVPDDGLYLPEEGTQNSYKIFKRRLSDPSRPTSYSPL